MTPAPDVQPEPQPVLRTRENRGLLETCAAKHVRPRANTAVELDWTRVWNPPAARVSEHTCERCRLVSYELCRIGGAYFVRRYDRATSAAVIHETAHVRQLRVEHWWRAVLAGAAY